jgi:sugar-specific transcriptional regulator TrmB
MDDEDVVSHLQELGLTAYQSRAYVAAVRLGTARPNELAEAAEIPQARIYDVIDDLADLSFVEIRERSGGKSVSAPPPESVLGPFRDRHVAEYTRIVDTITGRLDAVYEDDTSTDGFVTLVSMRESAIRHARQAIEEADFWLALSLRAPAYEKLRDAIVAALDRGVSIRLLLPADDADACTFPPDLRVASREGAETIAVADRTHGVFGSALHDAFRTDYVVSGEAALSTLFQDYFEWLWWDAESVEDDTSLPYRYLDPWRAVLDLGPALEDGACSVTVSGIDAATGRSVERTGSVTDWTIEPTGDAVAPGRATLTLTSADGEFSVGGPKETEVDLVARGLELDHAAE